MTTVYGVTFVGARAQIERQLKDRGDIPTEKCWDLASYLAKHVRTFCLDITPLPHLPVNSGLVVHWRPL